jgi:hypothetical protein
MLENQARYLNDVMTEEVRTSVVGNFLKFIFPMIRRAYADTIAPSLVSVQPMTAPVGGVAFFRPRYGSDKGSIAAGDEMITNFDFDYSAERVTAQPSGTGDGATVVFASQTKTPLRPATLQVYLNNVLVGSANAAGTIVDAGAGVLAAGSQVNNTTGQLTLVFAAAPAVADVVVTNYEYDLEGNPDVPEIRFDIQIQEIRAKPRKLKMLWTPEAEEDLRALWGLDITSELVGAASTEMALEIDREIINDLLQAALAGTNKVQWDVKTQSGVSQYEHLKGILVPLNQVSNTIWARTLRGAANWIVTSPDVVAILNSTDVFTTANVLGSTNFSAGIMKAGVLNNQWTVWVDPYMKPKNLMLLGRQGTNFLDTGFVFAPWVPIQVTGTFFDPGDFTLRKGIRTRFAKLLVRPEFYGIVELLNIR